MSLTIGIALGDATGIGPEVTIKALGQQPATVFSPAPVVALWSEVVDGVIVFREERAPTRTSRIDD